MAWQHGIGSMSPRCSTSTTPRSTLKTILTRYAPARSGFSRSPFPWCTRAVFGSGEGERIGFARLGLLWRFTDDFFKRLSQLSILLNIIEPLFNSPKDFQFHFLSRARLFLISLLVMITFGCDRTHSQYSPIVSNNTLMLNNVHYFYRRTESIRINDLCIIRFEYYTSNLINQNEVGQILRLYINGDLYATRSGNADARVVASYFYNSVPEGNPIIIQVNTKMDDLAKLYSCSSAQEIKRIIHDYSSLWALN